MGAKAKGFEYTTDGRIISRLGLSKINDVSFCDNGAWTALQIHHHLLRDAKVH
jgi:hypothetical protein